MEGKLSKYNEKFNNIKVLENVKLFKELKAYALQDVISLYKAMEWAQFIYFELWVTLSNSLIKLILQVYLAQVLLV